MTKEYLQHILLLRTKAGLAQQALANLLNIDVSAYSRKESGVNAFSVEEIMKLAEYFQVDVNQILYGTDNINRQLVKESEAEYKSRTTPTLNLNIQISLANAERLGIKDLMLEQMGLK